MDLLITPGNANEKLKKCMEEEKSIIAGAIGISNDKCEYVFNYSDGDSKRYGFNEKNHELPLHEIKK